MKRTPAVQEQVSAVEEERICEDCSASIADRSPRAKVCLACRDIRKGKRTVVKRNSPPTMMPVDYYASFLRKRENLSIAETKLVKDEARWAEENPDLVVPLDELVRGQSVVYLRRVFHSFDGSVYPKGMPLRVIDRWYGSLIVYSSSKALLLTVQPQWVRCEAKAKDQAEVPPAHHESGSSL